MACIFINFLLLFYINNNNKKIYKIKRVEINLRPVILCSSPKHLVPSFGTNARVNERPVTDNALYVLSNQL